MKAIRCDSLTPAQCRMARAALGLSVVDAAKASLVSKGTINRLESGTDIKPVLRAALRSMFEERGLVFTGTGVETRLSEEGLAA